MENHIEPKKRRKLESESPKQTETITKAEPIRDEADEISDEIEENTRKVHEMIFRAVVRVVLTLLIFGGMLYYFNYMNIPESQEERIKRVIGAEKAKQSNGPPIPF